MNNKFQAALGWFASATGAAVPAWGFFKNVVPPIFPVIGLILAPVSAAIIYVIAVQSVRSMRKLIRRGVLFLICGILFIFAYAIVLPQWTVLEPQERRSRFQVGFGLADWSLTTRVGLPDKQKNPDATPETLMMIETAFSPQGPEKIWKAWSITA